MIATDLDGTLLRRDKTVSDRTRAALAAAAAAGIEVVFATGRPLRWLRVVEGVPGASTAVCANGAVVADLRPGDPRVTRLRPLDNAAALRVVADLRAVAPGTSFALDSTAGMCHDPDYPPLFPDPGAAVGPIEELLTGALAPRRRDAGAEAAGTGGAPTVVKLLAHHTDLEPDLFLGLGRRAAAGNAEVTRSGPTALLEISGAGVTKAGTLAAHCALRGVSASEVVAFGDMPNDLELLSWAGAGFAMANAHPDVLAATPWHTADHEEDGVAVVIERLLELPPAPTAGAGTTEAAPVAR
ncbi:HAD hydrolase family protein [Streptomyces calidiresistens]|uniref:HAD hydrolase family protein n=1 Tax=Streptomyces calidiresistens TaxID=1485586 RepID=A0A7W3T7G0_9ACTN|nr:HAD hydrolase family protein [Streptomyces calidiresistens]MBB0232330.1 HAD hydrolase family protein [Streptomyces calidiresistens]